MSRIEFLDGLCKCLYMIVDLESMKNKSQAALNAYDEQIRESRGGPIDKLIQKGHKQKSLEVEILERLITYAHDFNTEHIDETINKVFSKIYGDDTPGSNDSQN